MFNRRSLTLLVAASTVVMSTVVCDVLDTRESDALLEAQNMTSIAAEATRFARDLSETAQASITPLPTATDTPLPPAVASAPTDLPPAIFAMTDPSGDTFLCDSGQSVDDAAVDILSVMVFDPPLWDSDHDGWLARVELGAPAGQTFADDWSASLLAAFAAEGAPAFTATVNEVHAGETTIGTVDENFEDILPGTAERSYIDEQGNIWFLLPRDTLFMQFASFHTPTEDLPPEQKRCDTAPDEGPYTLELP
jgi:hypothetical protein